MYNIENGLNNLFSEEDNPQKLVDFILNFIKSVNIANNEFISAIDSKYEIIVDLEEGIKDEVPVPDAVKKVAEKSYTLVSIHNHPSGVLPTIADIIIGYKFNIKYNLNNNDKGATSIKKINPRNFNEKKLYELTKADHITHNSIMIDFYEKYPETRTFDIISAKNSFIKYYNNNINTMINIYNIHYNPLGMIIDFIYY